MLPAGDVTRPVTVTDGTVTGRLTAEADAVTDPLTDDRRNVLALANLHATTGLRRIRDRRAGRRRAAHPVVSLSMSGGGPAAQVLRSRTRTGCPCQRCGSAVAMMPPCGRSGVGWALC